MARVSIDASAVTVARDAGRREARGKLRMGRASWWRCTKQSLEGWAGSGWAEKSPEAMPAEAP